MAKKSSPPLYVGTSGWAYSIWKPEFYPKDVTAKNFLKFYATQLNAVEVNYTFRRLLSEKAADSWMNDTGPEFRFAPKANQYITHMRRLKDAEEPLKRDAGERVLGRVDLELLLGLDGLVQALGVAPAVQDATGELVDDEDFAVLHDVLDILGV